MKDIIISLIENPTILSAVFLPIIILVITNRNNVNLLGQQSSTQRQDELAELMFRYEDEAYSSLVGILFDIQMLHVELSQSGCDEKCIDKALEEFIPKLKEKQAVVARHQLSLDSVLVDQIYSFYNRISEMIIHLSELKNDFSPSLVRACVSHNANMLATNLINFKKVVFSGRSQSQLRDMPNFAKCCGALVTQRDIELYLEKFDPEIVKKTQYEDGLRGRQERSSPVSLD